VSSCSNNCDLLLWCWDIWQSDSTSKSFISAETLKTAITKIVTAANSKEGKKSFH